MPRQRLLLNTEFKSFLEFILHEAVSKNVDNNKREKYLLSLKSFCVKVFFKSEVDKLIIHMNWGDHLIPTTNVGQRRF